MTTNMTHNENPWANIQPASQGTYSRLRVNLESSYTLFWFRDDANKPGLLIEISQYITVTELKKAKINIRDIMVNVIGLPDEGIRALVIQLEDQSNMDIFSKLCFDLVERITVSESSEANFYITCRRLKRWQALFSGQSSSLLSSNEIQGLYAELCFIAEKLSSYPELEDALIHGWEGTQLNQHDFIIGHTVVEIKSITGRDRAKVRISSEDQLHTHLDYLFLRIYLLTRSDDGKSGENLNQIIQRVNSLIMSAENRNLFEKKLRSARYIDIPDYNLPLFEVNDISNYQVTEYFPKIVRANLAEGIEHVSYDLVLARINQFKVADVVLGV